MPAIDDLLREAMAAHKAGRHDTAEAGYREVLRIRPEHPKALYYLALLSFHRGDINAALEQMRQCLRYAPSHAIAWNTFGSMLIAAGEKAQARDAYLRVTRLAPNLGEGWYNLAVCQREEGDIEGALASFRTATAREPAYTRAWNALGSLLYELGRIAEAREVHRAWLDVDPGNPVARHMAAATSQQDVPSRASDEYVRDLFDASARTFDATLSRLEYRAPERVASALFDLIGERRIDAALDAGCGTGLCGPLLQGRCSKLVGVDLSSQMIARARSRGCYDELSVAELSAFMRSRPGQFDAIVSADTLCYFGDLTEPLAAAHTSLRDAGVLVFTLEALSPESAVDYRLEPHGRYAHSAEYVQQCLLENRLVLHQMSTEVLRKEGDRDVVGHVVVCRK